MHAFNCFIIYDRSDFVQPPLRNVFAAAAAKTWTHTHNSPLLSKQHAETRTWLRLLPRISTIAAISAARCWVGLWMKLECYCRPGENPKLVDDTAHINAAGAVCSWHTARDARFAHTFRAIHECILILEYALAERTNTSPSIGPNERHQTADDEHVLSTVSCVHFHRRHSIDSFSDRCFRIEWNAYMNVFHCMRPTFGHAAESANIANKRSDSIANCDRLQLVDILAGGFPTCICGTLPQSDAESEHSTAMNRCATFESRPIWTSTESGWPLELYRTWLCSILEISCSNVRHTHDCACVHMLVWLACWN